MAATSFLKKRKTSEVVSSENEAEYEEDDDEESAEEYEEYLKKAAFERRKKAAFERREKAAFEKRKRGLKKIGTVASDIEKSIQKGIDSGYIDPNDVYYCRLCKHRVSDDDHAHCEKCGALDNERYSGKGVIDPLRSTCGISTTLHFCDNCAFTCFVCEQNKIILPVFLQPRNTCPRCYKQVCSDCKKVHIVVCKLEQVVTKCFQSLDDLTKKVEDLDDKVSVIRRRSKKSRRK